MRQDNQLKILHKYVSAQIKFYRCFMTKILVATLKVSITVMAIYFLYRTDKLEYQHFYRDIIHYNFLIISSLLGIAVIVVNQIGLDQLIR